MTRIISITVEAYGLKPGGRFTVMGEGFTSNIDLQEAEARQLMDQAFRFFEARQKTIGNSIATATLPNLLEAPIPDADFEEVTF